MTSLRFRGFGEAEARVIPLSPAWSLLTAIQRAGGAIRHDCGGKALCGTCRLALGAEGGESPPAGPAGLSAMGQAERERLLALGAPLDGSVRLACQAHASRELSARALVPPEDP